MEKKLRNNRNWLTCSWYTLPRIAFIIGCCIFFALVSSTVIIDDRGFGCSISSCIDTQNIDQSRSFDSSTQEPSVRDTFGYVTFNPMLAPSLFLVRSIFPEQHYAYVPIGVDAFFIDRADESFVLHTNPNVVVSDTDENDMKDIADKIFLLSLVNVPIWLFYSVGMLSLAERRPKLWYLWFAVLFIFAFLAFISAQFSAEHFG